MGRIKELGLLVCLLAAASAWAVPFADDFDRPDGNVGNGWTILRDGTVDATIVGGEVLVSGTTSASPWVRCGISRVVVGETKFSCDFKNDNVFNFHMQVTLGNTVWSQAYLEVYAWVGGPLQYANSLDGNWPAAGWVAFSGANAQTTAGQYNNLKMELGEGGVVTVTLNGKLVGTVTNPSLTKIGSVTFASDADANTTGSVHIDNVQIGDLIRGVATDPNPAAGATDVPADVVLGWTAGEFAAAHDVYLGTSPQDVADATAADPKGVLVSQGQAGASYATQTPLEYGQTYYWRVDEVNAAPDSTVIAGGVWSFTVEPRVYPITGVTATASSSGQGAGPQNTVNGSGLNASDQHSTDFAQMWMSAGALPSWIQYQFDKVYKLDEMWVWNSNQLVEAFVGFGAKDVTVEYSVDGATWTKLEGVPEFAQAPGAPAYAANTFVDFGGAMAKYVKLTIATNWGGVTPQAGLSEVRFYYLPTQARGPQPAVAATGVALDTDLYWRPGRDAQSHEVYLGTDRNALALVGTPTEHTFRPASLNFGTAYYWKVNEIGGTGPYEGDVWNFSTQEYAVIDDIESYNDDDNRIYETWIDGLTTGASGSQVGYDVAPFAERRTVHGGVQAMPFLYDNSAAPFFSEAEREFSPVQNWTSNGADTLSLWVQGAPSAYGENNGVITMSAAGHDIWDNADDFRFAFKTLNGDGSIVVKVESLVNTNAWAKAGVMIRQSLDADSTFVYMIQSFSSGVSMGWRPTTGAACGSATQAGIAAPQWVKLTRKGNVFTAQYSANGTTWTDLKDAAGAIASTTVAMNNPVYVGLCVTSHNTAATTTAVMSGAVATGNVTGASWQVVAIGDDPQAANDAADLYAIVQDSAGKTAKATNPTAVTTAGWTQWRIPLSRLTGVNLKSVKKLILGVDSRTSPTKGTGRIYIDDIGYGHPLQ